MVEAGGGAEDDADDQTPGGDAEPFVDHPAKAAKGDHDAKESDARRVGKAGFPVLFLIFFLAHQLSRVR